MAASPAVWAGAVTSSFVAEVTDSAVPVFPAKVTLVTWLKLAPVTVTRVPPPVVPEEGVIAVILGGDT
jgi:hypothetical protein